MGFEIYKKGSAPVATVPAVTVQKRGLISLNRTAYALIGNPEAVELLWDADRKVIGLRASELTNPNAYPARPQSLGSDKGPILVAGNMFTQYIGMDTSRAVRWIPTVEDEILCIDIGKPGQLANSNRRGKANANETTPESAAKSVGDSREGNPQPVQV